MFQRTVGKLDQGFLRFCPHQLHVKVYTSPLVWTFLLVVGVDYGSVVTMWPQNKYDCSPLLVSKNKVYIAKLLQHLNG